MAKRLLFVITTSDFGGTETFLQRLLLGLDRGSFEPLLCSLCPLGRIGDALAAAGIEALSLGMAAAARPQEMVLGAWRLRRLIDERGIDLVQSLLYRANVLAALAKRLSRRRPPLVTGQRSLIPAGRSHHARFERWTRPWVDHAVAVSEAVKKELLASEALDPQRVSVIQNGIDLDRCAPAAQGREQRRSWRIEPERIVIGAVGRLHPPKGLKFLIAALAQARQRDPRLVLVIVGAGPEETSLRQQVEALGLGPFVLFLGYAADPFPLYPAFDIFALPSLAEGSPNALLEAMGSARACVASAVGGVLEVIEDGISGLLVPPGDAAALAEKLLELGAEAELRHRLGQAGRQRIEAAFDVQVMIRRHQELYRRLLGGAA